MGVGGLSRGSRGRGFQSFYRENASGLDRNTRVGVCIAAEKRKAIGPFSSKRCSLLITNSRKSKLSETRGKRAPAQACYKKNNL